MFMKLKDGKSKALTLSYDDGVVQDIRLMKILDKHGIKATFNINTGLFIPEDTVRQRFHGRMKWSEAKALYTGSGHEVAVHAVTHPFMEKLKSAELLREILDDRQAIEREFGTIARGMAYPYGTYNNKVVDILARCGIAYARTVHSTHTFGLPENWLTLHPTCHHKDAQLEELAKRFIEGDNRYHHPELFYLWGHSYEFDNDDNWDVIERFAAYAGGHDHVWYATNIEVYDYVQAYNRLETGYDKTLIHNPSAIDVWVEQKGKVYRIPAGETVSL
jgi:peptidoglycan/xylan/chitin deacetylase (PgdA/CDA1 family)